jgi:cholesterol transport system auxiliary component
VQNRFIAMALGALLLSGCASLPGGGASNDTYALSSAGPVQTRASARNQQILIAEPTALRALDSERIVIRTSPSAIQYLSNSQWTDRLPRMLQASLVEAFENTGQVRGVGQPGEGLAIDFQVVTTVRSFEVIAYGTPTAVVELSVRMLDDRNGNVRAQRVFRATSVLTSTENEGYVQALDRAFSQVTGEIVGWALAAI